MNLNHLYYFQKLAELEHFTRASEILYISQPSLSSAMNALEDELSCSLFAKSGRNVKLTNEGHLFYTYVVKALSFLESGINSLHNYKEQNKAKIKILSANKELESLVLEKIKNLDNSKNLLKSLELDEFLLEKDALKKLFTGEIDYLLTTNKIKDNKLNFLILDNFYIEAYVSKNHILTQEKANITLEKLQEFPIFILESLSKLFDFSKLNLKLKVVKDHLLSLNLAQNSDSIILASDKINKENIKDLAKLKLKRAIKKINIFLYSKLSNDKNETKINIEDLIINI